MAAGATPSDLPAWLRDAVPYEPPAAASWPTDDLVPPPRALRDGAVAQGGTSRHDLFVDAPSPEADEAAGATSDHGDPAANASAGGGVVEPAPTEAPERAAAEAGDEADDEAAAQAFTSKLVQWSRSAASGLVLAGIAGGLQRVFEPDERPQIVMEVPSPAPDDLRPVRLVFVPGDPKASVAFVRPWLLRSAWPPRG